MKTLEQLNKMTDYEINCAVAEKLGLKLYSTSIGDNSSCFIDLDNKGVHGAFPYTHGNWITNAGEYMSIAIEHVISIKLRRKSDIGLPYASAPLYDRVYADSNDQIPRAVCIAYLLMEPPKEID